MTENKVRLYPACKTCKNKDSRELRYILSEFYEKLYDIYFRFKNKTKSEIETIDLQNNLYNEKIQEILSLIQSLINQAKQEIVDRAIEILIKEFSDEKLVVGQVNGLYRCRSVQEYIKEIIILKLSELKEGG